MKPLSIIVLVFGLTLMSCNQRNRSNLEPTEDVSTSERILPIAQSDGNAEVRNLIKEVLKWANSERGIDLLPVVADEGDSAYVGFDLKKHNENLDRLEATGLFSKQFIENYNQIISRLDRKLRRNEFERGPWLVGHLPPFNFARDADPWCMCQDVPYYQPVPWEFVEIEALNGDSYRWKWGGLKAGTGPGWQEFRYEFRVARENSKWTVSYLQGFDISLILSDEISNRSTRAYWNRGKSLRFNCDNET